MKKRFFIAICIWTLLWLGSIGMRASTSIDITRAGTISVEYSHGDTVLVGAAFDLYRVATVSPDGTYRLCGEFASYPVDVNGSTAQAQRQTAFALYSYVGMDSIASSHSAVTDAFGKLTFPAAGTLDPGMYLLIARPHTEDGKQYTCEPTIVKLPDRIGAESSFTYDITLYPKADAEEISPVLQTVNRKVLVVWEDNNAADRPTSVTVKLVCDGTVYDTVTLIAADNWRYTWRGLAADKIWTALEVVPDGYTMSVTQEGITFVITNTKRNADPPPQTTAPAVTDEPVVTTAPAVTTAVSTAPAPDKPELPQTGQLWWPVPILAAIGCILCILGVIFKRGASDEE